MSSGHRNARRRSSHRRRDDCEQQDCHYRSCRDRKGTPFRWRSSLDEVSSGSSSRGSSDQRPEGARRLEDESTLGPTLLTHHRHHSKKEHRRSHRRSSDLWSPSDFCNSPRRRKSDSRRHSLPVPGADSYNLLDSPKRQRSHSRRYSLPLPEADSYDLLDSPKRQRSHSRRHSLPLPEVDSNDTQRHRSHSSRGHRRTSLPSDLEPHHRRHHSLRHHRKESVSSESDYSRWNSVSSLHEDSDKSRCQMRSSEVDFLSLHSIQKRRDTSPSRSLGSQSDRNSVQSITHDFNNGAKKQGRRSSSPSPEMGSPTEDGYSKSPAVPLDVNEAKEDAITEHGHNSDLMSKKACSSASEVDEPKARRWRSQQHEPIVPKEARNGECQHREGGKDPDLCHSYEQSDCMQNRAPECIPCKHDESGCEHASDNPLHEDIVVKQLEVASEAACSSTREANEVLSQHSCSSSPCRSPRGVSSCKKLPSLADEADVRHDLSESRSPLDGYTDLMGKGGKCTQHQSEGDSLCTPTSEGGRLISGQCDSKQPYYEEENCSLNSVPIAEKEIHENEDVSTISKEEHYLKAAHLPEEDPDTRETPLGPYEERRQVTDGVPTNVKNYVEIATSETIGPSTPIQVKKCMEIATSETTLENTEVHSDSENQSDASCTESRSYMEQVQEPTTLSLRDSASHNASKLDPALDVEEYHPPRTLQFMRSVPYRRANCRYTQESHAVFAGIVAAPFCKSTPSFGNSRSVTILEGKESAELAALLHRAHDVQIAFNAGTYDAMELSDIESCLGSQVVAYAHKVLECGAIDFLDSCPAVLALLVRLVEILDLHTSSLGDNLKQKVNRQHEFFTNSIGKGDASPDSHGFLSLCTYLVRGNHQHRFEALGASDLAIELQMHAVFFISLAYMWKPAQATPGHPCDTLLLEIGHSSLSIASITAFPSPFTCLDNFVYLAIVLSALRSGLQSSHPTCNRFRFRFTKGRAKIVLTPLALLAIEALDKIPIFTRVNNVSLEDTHYDVGAIEDAVAVAGIGLLTAIADTPGAVLRIPLRDMLCGTLTKLLAARPLTPRKVDALQKFVQGRKPIGRLRAWFQHEINVGSEVFKACVMADVPSLLMRAARIAIASPSAESAGKRAEDQEKISAFIKDVDALVMSILRRRPKELDNLHDAQHPCLEEDVGVDSALFAKLDTLRSEVQAMSDF